jgi:CRP-like cAMP-binding protein
LPTPASLNPKQNRILAELATNEYARLQDDLELINLKLGEVLFNPGDAVDFVYFPLTSIVSLTFTTRSGASAELAMIGNEGLVGVPLVLGGVTTNHRVIVQNPGAAYRLKVEVIRWELDQGGSLQHLALRHTQALMTQMAQSVVCNRHPRHRSAALPLAIAQSGQTTRSADSHDSGIDRPVFSACGVRRSTEAAGKLQLAGLIQYSRGLHQHH